MDLVTKKIDFLHLVILFKFILLLYYITWSFFRFYIIVILYLFLFSCRHRFPNLFFQKDKHDLSYHTTMTNPIVLLLSKLFPKEFRALGFAFRLFKKLNFTKFSSSPNHRGRHFSTTFYFALTLKQPDTKKIIISTPASWNLFC